MLKTVFITVAAMLALACLGLAEDTTPPVGSQNRITPIDDGTIRVNTFENGALINDIDNLGSYISRDQDRKNGSVAYAIFDLNSLVQVADQNLVLLKIYADNSNDLEELVIVSDRILSMKDGTSNAGFFMGSDHYIEAGSGFALFNLTDQIKTLQQHGQNEIAIFFIGENLSIGTIEGGKPVEIIVI